MEQIKCPHCGGTNIETSMMARFSIVIGKNGEVCYKYVGIDYNFEDTNYECVCLDCSETGFSDDFIFDDSEEEDDDE
jgi:hypothetical protein